MSAKKIIAMFAVVGAQDTASAPDGRIFSDDFNGVNVNDFLYNSDSSYIYENLDANYGANYANYGDYDGTANQNEAESAGRPNAGDNNNGAIAEKSGGGLAKPAGFNECRVCVGQTAAECQAAPVFDSCNDAEDACMIEVRSEYVGSSIVHKFWSGCASQFACNERYSNNFFSTDNSNDAQRNLCRGNNLSRRNYTPSQCTFCTKLGNQATATTLLFGSGADVLDVNANGSDAMSWAALLANPTSVAVDLYAAQGWY